MSERDDSSGSVREIARREFLLRWARRIAFSLFVAGLCCAAYGGYAIARQKHLAKQARTFLDRGEYQSAALVARRLLALDNRDIAACRVMAEMAEMANRPEAVEWRKRVLHIEPLAPENHLALAVAALRFRELELASRVLNGMPEQARQSAKFHETAGALALAQKEPAVAAAEFRAALQLDPKNPRIALNAAIVGLAETPERAAAAREDLSRLAADSPVRNDALRALAGDAANRGDRAAAQQWAAKLLAQSNSSFADQVLYLEASGGTEPAAIDRAKTAAATSASNAAELATWMNRHGMSKEALAWTSALPQAVRETQPVPLTIAESYSFQQDWHALHTWIVSEKWGAFESYRLAVESHALHRLSGDGQSTQAQNTWRAALRAAEGHADQLTAIAQLAEGWGYKPEAEDAWWAIANDSDNPRAALSGLQRHYKLARDTRGLLRVARRAFELNPEDLIAANNCASLGLLITGDSTARRLATKLHTEHPANAAFAATYAFALHTDGKTAEGLKVLASLPEAQLRNPAIATYYFVMLVENGEVERAKSYLEIARTATLLPEEQQLLAAATRKLAETQTPDRRTVVAHS